MHSWPGSRGRPTSSNGRGTYRGDNDLGWRGRNYFSAGRMWNQNLPAYHDNEAALERDYGGGWEGPWGAATYDSMRGSFADLQPGGVRRGRRRLRNSPRHGGFV